MVNRPNLAQPIDVNTLDDLLRKAITPESAALPVLKYTGLLNPRQTAYMLQKLPRMEQLYRWGLCCSCCQFKQRDGSRQGGGKAATPRFACCLHKPSTNQCFRSPPGCRLRYGAQYDESQRDAYRALVYSLQQRLAQVLPDCNGQQLEQALWGLTTAG